MRNFLTASDIANTVRLTRSLHSGAIIITEGDTDARLFKRFFSKNHCKIIPAQRKVNAIQASIILSGKMSGVLTIVDADFDILDGVPPPNQNILYTDTHDLETMILQSSVLEEKILSELQSQKQIKNLKKPLIEHVLDAAFPLGCFRWLSTQRKENLNLKFDGLNLSRFIDIPSFQVNIQFMITDVINNTSNCKATISKVKIKLSQYSQIICHDQSQL